MIRRPPVSTLTDTLFPYSTLFRSWTAPILLFLVILAWPEGGRASGNAIRPAGPGDVRIVDGDTLWIGRTKIRLSAYDAPERSEEHTSELQSLMRISYAVFCLKKKK